MKVKVNSLEIIARMIDNNPYYELKYRQVGKNNYHIGYSSYDLKIVLGYIDKYFEIVEKEKKMTVMDFYKVAGISEKIMIRKIVEGNGYSYIKLLYEGSINELPLDMLEMYVLDIRVSRETCSMIVTVD